MPNGKKIHLSPEQVRQRVDQVMDRWQSFRSFAPLFDALLHANCLNSTSLAKTLTSNTTRSITFASIDKYRLGEVDPPYSFIEDLLATNALQLDPRRIQPANGEYPAGDHRVALFSTARLIEVTPESIRNWNREVLAGHRLLLERGASIRPSWGDLAAKLLSFHRQGERQTLDTIAIAAAGHVPGDAPLFPHARITLLLNNRRPATANERFALARQVGLEDDQIAYIEDGIASRTIPLGPADRHTPFAAALGGILDKLTAQRITLTQLASRCEKLMVPGAIAVNLPDLSVWRYGRAGISLEKLRSLAAGLRQFGPEALRDPVTPGEVDHLISAAGFKPHELTDTTHQVIARIDDCTRIKKLLADLRYAADLSMTAENIAQRGKELGCALPSPALLSAWEQPARHFPTDREVRELLDSYNQFIRRNGFTPLNEEEIAKVVAVAERDHANWKALSHTEKLGHRKHRERRSPPEPSFDHQRGRDTENGLT
jgi:transcriptional regulator with XRE-family HTH domain